MLFFLLILLWFIGAGIFFAEKIEIGHWLASLFIYSVGVQWVFTGTFGLTMYAPYVGTELKANNDNKDYRAMLFLIGVGLMMGGSLV